MTITNLSNESMEKAHCMIKFTCLEWDLKTKTDLDDHVESIHPTTNLEEIKFVCGKCKHEFVQTDDYENHVKEHEDGLHMEEIHDNKSDEIMEHTCKYCNFIATSANELKEHAQYNSQCS